MDVTMKKLFAILDTTKIQLESDRIKEIDKYNAPDKEKTFVSQTGIKNYTIDGTIKHLAHLSGFPHHEEYHQPDKYLQQRKDLLGALRNFMWQDSQKLSEQVIEENDHEKRKNIGEEKKIIDNRIELLTKYISIHTKYIRELS